MCLENVVLNSQDGNEGEREGREGGDSLKSSCETVVSNCKSISVYICLCL